jgi:hypothetical protein
MGRLLAALLACAVLSGCGAERSVKDAVDPVAQAATRTAAAGRMLVAVSGSVSAAGQQIPLAGAGVFDLKAGRGRMRMTMSAPTTGEIKFDELIDGLVVYVHSDAITAGLPFGKHWIKVDVEELGREQGFDLAQLQQLGGGSDPTQWLTTLNNAGRVEQLGTEDIRGVPTTHYRATIDVDHRALPTDIWIDGQGLVRRQAVSYAIGQPSPMQMQFTMDFERFGVPVDVHPPDAGDTVDLSSLAGAR